jgi:hypothetical protein
MYGLIYGDLLNDQLRFNSTYYTMKTSMAMVGMQMFNVGYKPNMKDCFKRLVYQHNRVHKDTSLNSLNHALQYSVVTATSLPIQNFAFVLPVAYTAKTERTMLKRVEELMDLARRLPHTTMEAQAISLAIFLARHKASKHTIQTRIQTRFKDLEAKSIVHPIIQAFISGSSFDDVMLKADQISYSNSYALAYVGALAEAYYGMSKTHKKFVRTHLKETAHYITILNLFLEGSNTQAIKELRKEWVCRFPKTTEQRYIPTLFR